MPSIKKSLYFLASALFLSKSVMADDCNFVARAVNYLGNEFSKNYNVTDCCQFNGVKCNENKSVTGLKLTHIKDDTANPAKVFEKIGNLKELTYLDLSNNNLSINFPKEICGLTKLTNLNLSNNQLSGVIPYDCKNLQSLEQLNLSGNKDLNGYVPILNNLKGCVYQNTSLCYLPNANCRNAKEACNGETVKNTNNANGYPEKDSYKYEGMETSRDMNVYTDAQYYNQYDTSAYNNYDPNAYAYDTSYGYNNGYGYGYGYDDSYYGNGYSYGYDNSYYGSGGYDNYYGNGYDGYDYSSYGYTTGSSSSGGNIFTSLISIILYCVFFAVAVLVCCACCCCGGCSGAKQAQTSKPYTTHTTHTANVHKPAHHTVNMEQDITNNGLPPYSMPKPNVYPPQPGYGYGYNRGVEEAAEGATRAVETVETVEVKKADN